MRMQFLTTVNVTAVKLFGTATRGEKIDLESYTFEGWKKYLCQKLITEPNGEKSQKIDKHVRACTTYVLCCLLTNGRCSNVPPM